MMAPLSDGTAYDQGTAPRYQHDRSELRSGLDEALVRYIHKSVAEGCHTCNTLRYNLIDTDLLLSELARVGLKS
jgi:hypothetical protein